MMKPFSQKAAAAVEALPHYEAEARARMERTQAKPGEKIGQHEAAKATEKIQDPNDGEAAEHAARDFGDKLEEIREFVRWWDESVGVRQSSGDNQYRSSNHDLRSSLSKDDAESLTGITQQQVSRWRKKLQDEDTYRQAQFSKMLAALFLLPIQ